MDNNMFSGPEFDRFVGTLFEFYVATISSLLLPFDGLK